MKHWAFLALTIPMVANAQRPHGGATCSSGTPIPFSDGSSWGYLTTSGVTIQPQFEIAFPFSSGVAPVCTADGCGLIDTSGKFITPLKDKQVASFAMRYSEGIGPLAREDKWGYVDLSGNIVIPLKFEYAGDFDQGMAPARLNGKYFFINHKGDSVTQEFDGVFDFTEDLAPVEVGDKTGYIRRDGTFALPPIYHGTSGINFSEGLVAVRIDGKVGFIDKTGSVVVKPAYDDAYPFSEGLAPVRVGDTWGYIDRKGKMVIPPRFRIGHSFHEGVASVQLDDTGKMGYIDLIGAFAIPPTFDVAMPFCAGLAHVETFYTIGYVEGMPCRQERYKGRQGFIDHSGNYIWRDPMDRVWDAPGCN